MPDLKVFTFAYVTAVASLAKITHNHYLLNIPASKNDICCSLELCVKWPFEMKIDKYVAFIFL